MLFGVVLISGLVGGDAYGTNAPLGVAIGLVTAASYAGYLLVIRRATPDRRAAGPVTIATAVCALVAAVFGTIVGDFDPVPSLPSHAYLLALGVTSQSIGYILIQVSLPRLPAVLTSAILLTQPVMTVCSPRCCSARRRRPARSPASCWSSSDWRWPPARSVAVRDDLRGTFAPAG